MQVADDGASSRFDEELAKAAGEQTLIDAELMFTHLRDARLMLDALPAREPGKFDRVLAKGAIVLACAALEANLAHYAAVAESFERVRPGIYNKPQLEYLRGYTTVVDERGKLTKKQLKQSLEDRLKVVPDLVAQAIGRRYELLKNSAAHRKLTRTIERRDAIIHPRWQRYINRAGWYEAAEAVDAVELYLQSVQRQLHPYLAGYFAMLGTIPPGWHKNDGVDVGYRTRAKKRKPYGFDNMSDVGLPRAIVGEWVDAALLTQIALGNGIEGDSEGSMLSRASLILNYAMIDAQLGILSQWRIAEDPSRFDEAELNFLSEVAVGIGHDGEVAVSDESHPFKKRILAIPRILSNRVENHDAVVDLGNRWGETLLYGSSLRNRLMHSPTGEPIPRVPLKDLLGTALALKSYFAELVKIAPTVFQVFEKLLDIFDLPTEAEVEAKLSKARTFRKTHPDLPILFSWFDEEPGQSGFSHQPATNSKDVQIG